VYLKVDGLLKACPRRPCVKTTNFSCVAEIKRAANARPQGPFLASPCSHPQPRLAWNPDLAVGFPMPTALVVFPNTLRRKPEYMGDLTAPCWRAHLRCSLKTWTITQPRTRLYSQHRDVATIQKVRAFPIVYQSYRADRTDDKARPAPV
jgi:hypothetical protein